MNKRDLIDSIASASGLTKADSARALSAFITSVSSALKAGDDIRLIGFGTFSVSKKAATTAINPRTRETVKVPARKVAKVKAGKALQDSVDSKK